MPGTIMDSAMITCDNYGWVEFGLNGTTFDDGNFYIVYWQISIPPYSPPVGIDEENPVVFRSYVKQAGMEWQMSSYNDFMMRAVVFGPGDNVMAATAEGPRVIVPKPTDGAHIAMKNPGRGAGTVKGGTFKPVADQQSEDRNLDKYRIAFVDGFDPNAGEMPWDGTLTPIGTTGNNQYTDNGWGSQDPGFYAYAVRAEYTSSESVWAYSNVAAHLLDREVTVNVTQCNGQEPSNALVTMMGHNYPYQMLSVLTPASGTVVFDSIIIGLYDLTVTKLGYQTWAWPNMVVGNDMTVDVVLQETTYPPRNLYVDPLTSVATWDEPVYIQIPFQGFEDPTFPPVGWQNQHAAASNGWERSNGYSGSWTVPPLPPEGGDWFALAEDDSDLGDDCCSYLITPVCNLTEADDYALSFLYFWDGYWGSAGGFIEYSLDNGATWELLEQLSAVGDWTSHTIDLSDMSGADGESAIWFGFHYDDNGYWADGFAVDNVYLGDGPVPSVVGYHVYINDGFVGGTNADTRTYQYKNLQYGTTYTAAVAALYACNVSAKVYYTFTSSYLYPPRDLMDTYVYNTNEVPLWFKPPMTVAGPSVPPAMAESNGDATVDTGKTYFTEGAEPMFDPIPARENGARGTDDGLDVAFLTSSNSGSNDFSAMSSALLALGINSVTVIYGDPTLPTLDELWDNYDGVLYGLNTFLTGITGDQVGDFLADYVDGGGKLIMTSPTNATGYTNLPIGGRFLNDGYYPVSTGSANFNTINLGDFDPDHPIMDGVTSASGGLTVSCSLATDAELVASWSDGTVFVGTKTITNPVVQVNVFIAASGYVTGDVDLVIFNAFNWLQSSGPGGGGEIPPGLLSFNIYRDGMMVGSKPYSGEAVTDSLLYVDNDVDPGCYDYTVTAVYNLAAYGYPGQTAESGEEGPDNVCVVWGYDLPFMEDWTSGNFGFNGWNTSANNWVVSAQMGNPAPSAQFNWDPDPGSDYSVTLESPPLKADMMTEGDIWLDFEYYLDDRTSTGMENLAVEVYNGHDWMQVAEYSNTSDVDWTFQHLQITNYAMGRVFKVRFNAMGTNSFDIINWNVDNIHVYRECESPSNLDGEYVWNDLDDLGAKIMWEAPELPPPPEGWLLYHNGTIEYVWGSNSGDWESDVAMYFEPDQLVNYPDCAVTKVRLFVDSRGANGAYCIAKVWAGADAATLLYEEDITDQISWNDDINEIALAQAVPFDNTMDLWIGFTTGGPVNTYVAGITEELTEPERRGDLYREGGSGWQHLSDLGIGERVWIFEAYVTQDYNMSSATAPSVEARGYTGHGGMLLANSGSSVSADTQGEREFTGFNIYRMGPGESDYTLIDNVPYDEGVTSYEYYDQDPYSGYPYEVCYQVTAVWESETDYCESMPAASIIPIYDYVCITVTGIDNPMSGDVTVLYPNPAKDRVNVSTSHHMDHITVINYVGQVVYDRALSGEQTYELNTSSYDAGVYIVKINTKDGVVTKRMTITR